jgi:hypothetical protein
MCKALKIIKSGIKLKKLWPPKIEGVKRKFNKPLNATKANSIKVQMQFVKLQVAFL